MPTEETFKKVFAGILDGVKKETEEKYNEVIKELGVIDMEDFDMLINYPLGNCIQAFHKTSDGAFIYEYFRYVENAFSHFIEHNEGSACSVDKSRFIVRGLYNRLEKNKEFTLVKNEDKEYWKTKCLDVPDCIAFFKAIQSAFYGNHVKLVQFYLEKSRKDN